MRSFVRRRASELAEPALAMPNYLATAERRQIMDHVIFQERLVHMYILRKYDKVARGIPERTKREAARHNTRTTRHDVRAITAKECTSCVRAYVRM